MKEHKLRGNEFCDFKVMDPLSDMPPIANFEFKTKKDFEPITGSGIYSIYYDSMLLYVGEYNGKKNKEGLKDPFSGCVSDRWHKHIALLTGRSRDMFFKKTNLEKIEGMEDCELKDLILKGEPKVMKKARAHNYSFRKFEFSAENWDDFKNLDVEVLKRFTFFYSKYIPSDFDTPNFIDNEKKARLALSPSIVGAVEKWIIKELQPKCNTKYVKTPSDNSMEESMKVIREQMKKAIKIYF